MNELGNNVLVAPISGGTDVAAFYAGCNPIMPVYASEMQCRILGTAVYAFDEEGNALEDEVGELVVTSPCPPCRCTSGATKAATVTTTIISTPTRGLASWRLDTHPAPRRCRHLRPL
ncbi:hypothetical protein [Stutzerimonas stutzeri]|uniref:hypothetical protein n=1 Tax=Stutzerimonas stutzeri TaxID=316 RepID=UPI00210AB015|nr:hypothetical protein [Stutzerimonas stutzeri]MCQ4323118.1 hypothetical protein [Stutzerimonas stutzeri]